MTDDLTRRVAERLAKIYPEPGYYRRASCYNHEWEKCEEGDFTPDHPVWKADYYYLHPKLGPRAHPPWRTSVDAALGVLDKGKDHRIVWVSARQEYAMVYDKKFFTYSKTLEGLPRAILEAFLEVGG